VYDLVAKVGSPKFDEEGLLAVIKDVQSQYNGAEKSYITGFSAGGNTTWIMTLYHPDLLAGVAFSSGSYSGRGIFSELVSQAPERETLPIMFFEGALYASIKENYTRFQTVKSIAENGGFHNITYQVTPGVGHAWQLEKTFSYFADLHFQSQGL
jgi:dienelactone hydrolase